MTKPQTPLYEHHQALGAKMVDFAGWQMPIQYQGIAAEHRIVRSTCGVFDLGHMGRLLVSGTGAAAFLDREITRPIASMQPTRVRYGLVCAEDGTVEDDVLVSRETDDCFHVVVNASNHGKILARWQDAAGDDVTLADLTDEQGMIAVQGPDAAKLLADIGLNGIHVAYYQFTDVTLNDVPVRLSRTGYTGEDGFELFAPAAAIAALWDAVVAAGAIPCGLGARDTLRLEAGMPLYGHELDRDHTPIQAGLGFAVGRKGGFIGSDALQAERDAGPTRKLMGLRLEGRRPARAGYSVVVDGETIGLITSGAPSPTLEAPIAMAYLAAEYANPGTNVAVDIRGSEVPASVCELPFYKRER